MSDHFADLPDNARVPEEPPNHSAYPPDVPHVPPLSLQHDAELPKIKVFVSSPGDVGEERRAAGRIINRLADHYRAVCSIEPYFWEYAKITSHFDFQTQIPRMEDFDVCVCILWSRLGTPLTVEGTLYQSGTEYEIKQSKLSFERLRKPLLFVYRRKSAPDFDSGPEPKRSEAREQYQKLQRFFADHFQGGTTGCLRASHSYESRAEFEDKFGHQLQEIIHARLAEERKAAVRWDRGSPFRGLQSFNYEDSAVFCGRNADVYRITEKLLKQYAAKRGVFLLLLGPSGCGKSSLAKAGVLSELYHRASASGPINFRHAVLRPALGATNPDPMASLASALQQETALPDIAPDVLEQLHRAPGNSQQIVDEALRHIDGYPSNAGRPAEPPKLILIVDQLEELFTYSGTTDRQRVDFARALLSLKESGTTWIVATLRQDFYDVYCKVPELLALKGSDGQYDLSPPVAAEIEQIIFEPARAAGLRYETRPDGTDLFDMIRQSAASRPGSLPLLEFCLEQLYQKMEQRLNKAGTTTGLKDLLIDDYRQAGGMEGIITSQAEKAYQSVPDECRNTEVLRKLLRMLVHVSSEDGAVTRRVASFEEINSDPRVAALAKAFDRERLLTVNGDCYELTHEAVLKNWQESRNWLDAEGPLLRARSRLQAVYFEPWKEAMNTGGNARKAYLPRGLPLEAALGVRKAGLLDEPKFAELRDYVARSQRWHRNRRTGAFCVIGVVALVLLTGAVSLIVTQGRAKTASLATVRLLQETSLERHRADDDGTSAVLLGLALERAAGLDPDLEENLRTAIRVSEGRLLPLQAVLKAEGEVARCCSILHDGATAVVGTDSGRVYCIDVAKGEFSQPSTGADFVKIADGDRVESIASHPTRRAFAAATAKGLIKYVDLDAPAAQPPEIKYDGQLRSLGFMPNGEGLIVAGKPAKGQGDASGLMLYDRFDTAAVTRRFGVKHELYAAAASPASSWLVAGGGVPPHHRLDAWNLRAGPDEPPREIQAPSRIFVLAFRPGSETEFVTGDVNGMVYFWDLARQPGDEFTGRAIKYEKQVRLTRFSRDGQHLLVGGESKLARIWNVEGLSTVGQILLHHDQVRAGGIADSVDRAITVSFAGDIRIWKLSSSAEEEQILHHPSAVVAASFSDDGREVAAGFPSGLSGPGGGFVWELASGRRVKLPHGADVMAVQFRPRHPGEVITCGNDAKAKLWKYRFAETPDGHQDDAQLLAEFDYGGDLVYTAAFAPSGDQLVYAGIGDGIFVSDYDRQQNKWKARAVLHDDDMRTYTWGLRFDSASDKFFSDAGASVRAWCLTESGFKFQDLKHASLVESKRQKQPPEGLLADLSPDSNFALVRWTDGDIAIFDLNQPEPVPQRLGDHPHGTARGSADWCDTKDLIATGGSDGTAMLWTRESGNWQPKQIAGRQVVFYHPSPIVLLELDPAGHWLATACEDGSLRLWSVDNGLWSGAGWYHNGPVTRMQFNTQGTHLLSAGRDGTVKVVGMPKRAEGSAKSLLDQLKADAGVEVSITGEGTSATYSAPRAISESEFRRLRASRN
ncbi:MAG TPA: NACHT and WD repeat domain-containing protein [Pirellulales bacterium]|nr:NACHT and WD repeat domain-containing protein [Pirellulales bacterium]